MMLVSSTSAEAAEPEQPLRTPVLLGQVNANLESEKRRLAAMSLPASAAAHLRSVRYHRDLVGAMQEGERAGRLSEKERRLQELEMRLSEAAGRWQAELSREAALHEQEVATLGDELLATQRANEELQRQVDELRGSNAVLKAEVTKRADPRRPAPQQPPSANTPRPPAHCRLLAG